MRSYGSKNNKQRLTVSFSSNVLYLSSGIKYELEKNKICHRYCFITEKDNLIRITFDSEHGDKMLTESGSGLLVCVKKKHYDLENKKFPATIKNNCVEFKYA